MRIKVNKKPADKFVTNLLSASHFPHSASVDRRELRTDMTAFVLSRFRLRLERTEGPIEGTEEEEKEEHEEKLSWSVSSGKTRNKGKSRG